MKVIRFEIHKPESSDVNRLPKGVKGNKSLMMWKELCRTGDYKTDGTTHHITLEFFQNMINSFKERLAKGVEIPCPKGHNHDPENKRGRVLHLEIRPNKDAGYSLWGIIEFIDPQAKKLLQNSDVSIDSPEELVDGDGTTYRYALEHVAFTDYPVVAGMEGFQDVKFSVIKETFDERWNIDLLLNKLGLVGDYGTPSDAYRAIYDKFLAITGKAGKKNGQKNGASRDSEDEEEGERQMSKRLVKKHKFDTDELDFEDEFKEEEEVDFGDDGDDENMLEMACKSMGKKKFGEDEETEFSDDEDEDEFDLEEEDEEIVEDEFDLDGEDDEFDLDEEIEVEDEEFGLDDEDEFDLDKDEELDLDGDDEFELEDEDEFDLDEEDDDEFDLDEDEEFDLDEDEEFGLDEDDEEEALGLSTRRRKLAKRRSCGKRFSREASRLIRENRSMKIDALRRQGYITASQSNNLKRQFCANGISFSRDSEAEFNRIVDFAKSGPRTDYREHTGVQFGFKKESNILDNAVTAMYPKKK